MKFFAIFAAVVAVAVARAPPQSVAAPLPAEVIANPGDVTVEPAQVAPAQASAPLVQIIVNVNQQEQVPEPAQVPDIIPTPVVVVDEPAEEIDPTPVVVVPEPGAEINPIDVIAVGAIDYNPVDQLIPIPAQGGAGILV